MIKKFNIATPGRGTNLLQDHADVDQMTEGVTSGKAVAIVKALGGYSNITMYSHCATRLRYDVKDSSKVNDKALTAAGAFGVVKPSKTHVQVIIGPTVEILNNEILAGKPASVKATVNTKEVMA